MARTSLLAFRCGRVMPSTRTASLLSVTTVEGATPMAPSVLMLVLASALLALGPVLRLGDPLQPSARGPRGARGTRSNPRGRPAAPRNTLATILIENELVNVTLSSVTAGLVLGLFPTSCGSTWWS